jgi:hypothetical protein
MIRDYLKPHLDRFKMAEIRPQDIGSMLAKIRSDGRSAQMVKHIYSMIHKVFDDAVDSA